jgi:hypothetical protein
MRDGAVKGVEMVLGADAQAPRLLLAGRVIAREHWRLQSEQRGRLSSGA